MTTHKTKTSLSYRDAGVDIAKANQLVDQIKQFAQKTPRQQVISGIGGFGGLFALPGGYKKPVLVSGTDGVGTKLKLAIDANQHQHIGIDLVAMCVNDIITCGAKPLFFLDYYATSALDNTQAGDVIRGIAEGCLLADMTLLGGETAEMPGLYQSGDYDLAGFCVGIVEQEKIIDGRDVADGDTLIAIASSGAHANGYSLIRKIMAHHQATLSDPFAGATLGDTLLTPTRIYAKTTTQLIEQVPIKAMAHITGGGLLENIPRVLPNHIQAVIDTQSWQWPEIFQWLQQQGNVTEEEMWRTFNLGVGMVVIVKANDADTTLQRLHELGENAWVLGHISESEQTNPAVVMQ